MIQYLLRLTDVILLTEDYQIIPFELPCLAIERQLMMVTKPHTRQVIGETDVICW